MKTLLLMRHAEAETKAASDFERPLTPHGWSMAATIARQIIAQNAVPELILCSSALRTRQTCQKMLEGWAEHTPRIFYEDQLYHADENTYRNAIHQHAYAEKNVMIIGHNPTIHLSVLNFLNAAILGQNKGVASAFPPASCAILSFESDVWQDIRNGQAHLAALLSAR